YHFSNSPDIANILYTSPGKEVSRLIVARLASLGDSAVGLRRVLLERDAHLERLLPTSYTTYAPVIGSSPEGQKVPKLPKNLRDPQHVPFHNKLGPSSIWAGKRVEEMGDPQDQPDRRAAIEPPPSLQETLAAPLNADVYPYLTKEKASIVQQYVENSAEAGAFSSEGIVANSLALSSVSTGSPKPPAARPVGRRRQPAPAKRAVTAAASQNTSSHSAPAEEVEASLNASGERRRVAAPSRAGVPSDAAYVDKDQNPQIDTSRSPEVEDPFAYLVDLVRGVSNHHRLSGQLPSVSTTYTPASQSHPSDRGYTSHGSANGRTTDSQAYQIERSPLVDVFDSPPASLAGSASNNPSLVPLTPTATNLTTSFNGAQLRLSDQQYQLLQAAEGERYTSGAEPQVLEPEKRVFHRTMGQKARNKHHNNKPAGKTRSERLAEIHGPNAEVVTAPINQSESASSKHKKSQISAIKAEIDYKVQDFADSMLPILESFESFPGSLSFEIQIGCILIEDVVSSIADILIQPKTWNATFRPKHHLVQPRTVFTNLLTSSGADIDYILNLKDERKKNDKKPLFDLTPLATLEWYEFHCQTKNNEIIVISISANGDTFVSRPEALLGSVNIHCPNRVWDAAGVIKGSIEFKRGEDETTDNAIYNFLEKIYIPEGDTVCIYTRMPDGSILRITKAFAKRQSKHRCFTQSFDISTPADDEFEQDVIQLQITEIQSLIIGEFGQDRDFIRLRAKPYEAMVKEQRVWHEVSIVSPIVYDALRSNRGVELGEKNTWSAQAFLGLDTTESAAPSNIDYSPRNTATVGGGIIRDMFRIASTLVDKIDSVGLDSDGIGPYILEEQLQAGGRIIGSMSQLSASASMDPALQMLAATRSSYTYGAGTVNGMDSVSVMGGIGGEDEEFW
ncbi:hypothetical protein KEM54_002519, partial [Ascosphaera aggregata]